MKIAEQTQENDTNYVTMVDRACHIIDYLYNHNEKVGISDIARELSIPKANVFRIIKTMEKWGIIERDSHEKFLLGKRLIQYGNKAKEHIDLVHVATPYMQKLSKQVGETVNLGINDQNIVLIIHREEGEASILVSKLVPVTPLYCSSMGKLYLSQMNEEDLEDYFESERIERRTVNTLQNKNDYLQEKGSIIESKIAYDNEEYEYGLTCLSTAIFGDNEKLIATISVSGPTSRLKYKGFETLEQRLLQAAAEISKQCKAVML